MNKLETYGWNTFHREKFTVDTNQELRPGRVTSVRGFRYIIIHENGELETELSGKLLFGTDVEDLPKVGDWILYKDYDSIGYIIEVLPRMNELCRKIAGRQTARQVLGSNIDCALIVQGLDHDFNLMRLERYLVQLAACNISAVVVLNKTDLVTDPEQYRQQVLALKRPCPVHLCSTVNGFGLDKIQREVLKIGKTYILIGSSGAGKSSLLNAMLDSQAQLISETSDSTGKGRHTTTVRDLFLLRNGSLVIDTPGMREFGLTSEDGQSSEIMFPGLQPFVSRCRFTDCKHINEAGCGVLESLQSGELEPTIYEAYVKHMKEQRRFEITADERKRLGKQWGKMTKEAKDHRKKYKY